MGGGGGFWFNWSRNYIPQQCPYNKMLWSKSKKLLTFGKINSFCNSKGTTIIKISENSSPFPTFGPNFDPLQMFVYFGSKFAFNIGFNCS